MHNINLLLKNHYDQEVCYSPYTSLLFIDQMVSEQTEEI